MLLHCVLHNFCLYPCDDLLAAVDEEVNVSLVGTSSRRSFVQMISDSSVEFPLCGELCFSWKYPNS